MLLCLASFPKNLYILNAVRCPYVRTFVRNAGRGQLSSEWRRNENDVIMIIAGLWRYGNWRHVATGCNALVSLIYANLKDRVTWNTPLCANLSCVGRYLPWSGGVPNLTCLSSPVPKIGRSTANLETGMIWSSFGHTRSSELSPFDTAHTTSCSAMSLSCTVSQT